MKTIDLNCDVGEGIGNEAMLFPFISSCNISCGLHAGDDQTIQKAINLAIKNKVVIGAHPSFDDRANFGRVVIDMSREDLMELLKTQILKIKKMVESAGENLHHVKPHGALYNMAAKSNEISETIVSAIEAIDKDLLLYGMAESETQHAAKGRLNFVSEGFADRRYQSKSQLMTRKDDGLRTDIEDVKVHVRELLINNRVATSGGFDLLQVDSLCVHGDSPKAIEMVKEIRNLLMDYKFEIKAIE